MKNTNRKIWIIGLVLILALFIGVIIYEENKLNKLYDSWNDSYNSLKEEYALQTSDLEACKNESKELQNNITGLEYNISYLQNNITDLLNKTQRPLLSMHFQEWGRNVYGGLLFKFWMRNFGYIDGKNVVVKCIVNDAYGIERSSISKNMGTVDSLSSEYGEITMSYTFGETDLGYCMIISCSNCEILDERIPALKNPE